MNDIVINDIAWAVLGSMFVLAQGLLWIMIFCWVVVEAIDRVKAAKDKKSKPKTQNGM